MGFGFYREVTFTVGGHYLIMLQIVSLADRFLAMQKNLDNRPL